MRHLGFLRILSSPFRVMPDFIIIGAARCGTTSLYNYLIQHPCIYTAAAKEPGFFGPTYNAGILWYKAHFPSIFYKFYIKWQTKQDFLTGEGSTIYLLDQRAPKRVFEKISNVKLIVLLRNPMDRAYSNYNYQVMEKREKRSFNQAIEDELKISNSDNIRLTEYEHNEMMIQKAYSYLNPGIYVDQLTNWLEFFPKEQFLIIKTEEFNARPKKTLEHVFEFLGIPNYSIANLEKQHVGSYEPMDSKTRQRLIDFYKSHNSRLRDLLGIEWDA